MQSERRTSKRKKFIDRPGGFFYVMVRSDQHDVTEVVDVSVAGIGLEMASYLDPGRMVRVIYIDGDTTMYTTGTVTHCEQSAPQRHRVGIVFDFPHREDSNQFYKRVKSFLENDGADDDREGGASG